MSSKQMFYKITQTRSVIGLPPLIRKNMQALGLKRRFQVVYQKVSPSTAHRLSKVKELITVELVDHKKTPEEINAERKYKPGFELIKGDLLNKTY